LVIKGKASYEPILKCNELGLTPEEFEVWKIIEPQCNDLQGLRITEIHKIYYYEKKRHCSDKPQDQLTTIIRGLFMLDNVKIMDVTKDAYFAATELGEDLKLEPNDALAIDVMRQNDITEIYSFDEHFNQIDGITRLPSL
jgi:predicted nucleic acid-binding protein